MTTVNDHEARRLMTGKTVLVTGATGGIGLATALGLAERGAHVAIVGRHPGRLAAAATILGRVGCAADVFVADLSSQADIRRLAAEVEHRLPRLDVLVNNAGGYWNSRHLTTDGLERTFALNHLAPFLLTNLLLHRLAQAPAARVVTVASNAQAMGRIDFDDLQGTRAYSGARAYNQSKLATVLFTYELARRLRGTSVTANAVHPGVVSTSFGSEDTAPLQRLLVPLVRPLMKTPTKGAVVSIHVATSAELAHTTGQFFTPSGPQRSSRRSHDEALADRLWRVSSELTSLSGAEATLGPRLATDAGEAPAGDRMRRRDTCRTSAV